MKTSIIIFVSIFLCVQNYGRYYLPYTIECKASYSTIKKKFCSIYEYTLKKKCSSNVRKYSHLKSICIRDDKLNGKNELYIYIYSTNG